MRGRVVDAAPRGAITSLRREAGCCARDPSRDTGRPAIAHVCGELCPAAVLEPEVVDAVCCGLVGAVEHDQVAVVVVLDVADSEVERTWTDGRGESSRDGPADP
ncbi:MAG: hypothetical protein V9F04_12440 [Dermatophilaceae bacterium]